MPVTRMIWRGYGNAFGTILMRSSFIEVKWALAVNRIIRASAQVMESYQVRNRGTPRAPSPRKMSNAASSTIKGAIKINLSFSENGYTEPSHRMGNDESNGKE